MTVTGKYSDEPLCRLCRHPRVVHRGVSHNGPCAGIECEYMCKAFVAVAPVPSEPVSTDGDGPVVGSGSVRMGGTDPSHHPSVEEAPSASGLLGVTTPDLRDDPAGAPS